MMILKCIKNKNKIEGFNIGSYYLFDDGKIKGDFNYIFCIENVEYINLVCPDGLKFEEIDYTKVEVYDDWYIYRDYEKLGMKYGNFKRGESAFKGEELYLLEIVEHLMFKEDKVAVCLNKNGNIILIEEKGIRKVRNNNSIESNLRDVDNTKNKQILELLTIIYLIKKIQTYRGEYLEWDKVENNTNKPNKKDKDYDFRKELKRYNFMERGGIWD